MGLVADLSTGRLGVRFSLPPELERPSGDDNVAIDRQFGVAWQVGFYGVHLDLRPRHHELLVRDAQRCARDLFIQFSSTLPRERGLRTDDPNWSPLVSITPHALPGGPALTAIHRMSYQPGHEMLMGHLLVPVRAGLFELRLIARAGMTGLRESLLLDRALRDAPVKDPVAVMQRLGQAHYDDPAHDAEFPEHPLALLRTGLAWALERSGLTVTEPAEPRDGGEVELADVGFALVPPPRYLQIEGPKRTQFIRISITGTDGVHVFTPMRLAGMVPLPDPQAMEQGIRQLAEASVPDGASELAIDVAGEGPDRARAYLRYVEAGAPLHTLLQALRRPDGDVLLLALAAPRSTPVDELAADLAGVIASLRPLAPAAAGKKWWQFWR